MNEMSKPRNVQTRQPLRGFAVTSCAAASPLNVSTFRRLHVWPAVIALLLVMGLAIAAPRGSVQPDFILIDRDLQANPVRLVEVSERLVTFLGSEEQIDQRPIRDCIALLRPDPRIESARKGMLQLADGQRLPGEAVSAAADDDVLVWNHALLGRVQVPLNDIDWVVFSGALRPPEPGQADVVVLANGDRLEGFITRLGDPLVMEVAHEGQTTTVEAPLDRVVAARMVAKPQPPSGQRVWLTDGTVLDVARFEVSDDRVVRLVDPQLLPGSRTHTKELGGIAAVQFDGAGLTPLAELTPRRIEAPATRRLVPPPQRLGGDSPPLGLSDIRLTGPATVHYALPRAGMRFAAEVTLPPAARRWGDCELIVLDDDREAARIHVNGAQPTATINVPLRGSHLTLQLAEGANGPVQDQLILTRAMLLGDSLSSR